MDAAHLVLEDGTTFTGRSVGAPHAVAGEACFTTSMTGYQETVTDPSFAGQVVVFSYPLIGNYGVDERRSESDLVHARAVVTRRCRPEFAGWLAERGVPVIEGVDTRALVRRIRVTGTMRCAVGGGAPDALLDRARREPHIDVDRMLDDGLGRSSLALDVCTREPYVVGAGERIVVVDLGCKRSIVRALTDRGLEAMVVPPTLAAEEIEALGPRAVLVGNGPGDPAQLGETVAMIEGLLDRVPLFGICLGHQLLGRALGMRTFSLPFGHRGANHPVRVCNTSRVLVTVQNHGFAVDADDESLVSHVSLNDGTVEGLRGDGFASVQFHPEAAPGPRDSMSFFDEVAATCRRAPTSHAS